VSDVLLQRWRCPDCRSVFDVFVDSDTGRAEEMHDELCPICHARNKMTLGVYDPDETDLYDSGEEDSLDPCMACGSTTWNDRDYGGCSDCKQAESDKCARGHVMIVGHTTCVRCGKDPNA
jgi:hypothetical protein